MMRGLASVALWLLSVGLAGCLSHSFVEPPLTRAALAGDLPRVEAMLRQGAVANQHTRPGWGHALMAAANRAHNAAVIRALVKAGADPNQLGNEGCLGCCRPVALTIAADGENVRALLAAGASLHPAAPACVVSLSGEMGRIQALLQAGVRPDDYDWVPPIFDATQSLPLLLEAGATVSVLDRDGNSAIGYGASWSSPGRLTMLRQSGVPLVTNHYGQNALHMAFLRGFVPESPEVVSLLLDWGVPVNARDAAGRTPLWYSQEVPEGGQPSLLQWLERDFLSAEVREQKRNRERRRAQVMSILQRAGAGF